MANSFTQIHLQFIFAVQNRISLIDTEWKDILYQYITGILQTNKHKIHKSATLVESKNNKTPSPVGTKGTMT